MFTMTNNRIMLSDLSYRIGKKFVQVWLPGFSSLYFGLASIWDLPAADKVVGTCAVVATFLGVSLGFSSKQYDASGAALVKLDDALEKATDGSVGITVNEDGEKKYGLKLDLTPEELFSKDTVTFKVSKPQE